MIDVNRFKVTLWYEDLIHGGWWHSAIEAPNGDHFYGNWAVTKWGVKRNIRRAIDKYNESPTDNPQRRESFVVLAK